MTIFNIGQYEFFESVIKNYPELKKKIKYTNFLNNKNLSTILKILILEYISYILIFLK